MWSSDSIEDEEVGAVVNELDGIELLHLGHVGSRSSAVVAAGGVVVPVNVRGGAVQP